MTMAEVNDRFCVPMDVMKKYEDWGLGNGDYTHQDIDRLSLMMTLQDIGFQAPQIEQYMLLTTREGSGPQRLVILNRKRQETLDEIHQKEALLSRLDYLRYEITGPAVANKRSRRKQA